MTATMILSDGTRKALNLSIDNDPKKDREEIDVALTSSAYMPIYLSE